jgi:hypothetical protein
VRAIDGTIALEVIGALVAAIVVARLLGRAVAVVVCRVLDRVRRQDAPA